MNDNLPGIVQCGEGIEKQKHRMVMLTKKKSFSRMPGKKKRKKKSSIHKGHNSNESVPNFRGLSRMFVLCCEVYKLGDEANRRGKETAVWE